MKELPPVLVQTRHIRPGRLVKESSSCDENIDIILLKRLARVSPLDLERPLLLLSIPDATQQLVLGLDEPSGAKPFRNTLKIPLNLRPGRIKRRPVRIRRERILVGVSCFSR